MALDLNEILIKVNAESRGAQSAIAQVTEELKRLPNMTTATVKTNIAEAQASLAAMRAELTSFDRTSVDAKTDVEIGKSLAKIATLEAALASLPNRKKTSLTIDEKGDVMRTLARIQGGLAALTPSLRQTGEEAVKVGNSFRSSTSGLRSLGPLMQGVAIIGVAVLAPAFVAVGSAILGAAAAVGILATAFLAALGPVALIAGGVIASIAKVLGVRKQMKAADKAQQKAAVQGSSADNQAAAAAEQRHSRELALKNALEQRADAEKSLTRARAQAARDIQAADRDVADAQRDVATAAQSVRDETVNAYRAMRDAAEDVADAVRGIERAQLDLESAELGVQDAKQNLKDVREELGLTGKAFDGLFKKFQNVDFDPGKDLNRALSGANVKDLGTEDRLKLAHAILGVKQAKLDEKDATDGVGDAERTLADARAEEAKFARQGLAAYQPLVAAQRQSAQAERDLGTAIAKSNRLHKQGVDGAPGVVSALRSVRDANQAVAEAQHDLSQPIPTNNLGAAATAAGVAQAAYNKLTGAQKRFLDQLDKTVNFLKGSFKPIADRAFNGMTKALKALPALLAIVGPGLGKVVDSMFGAFGELGGTLALLAPEINQVFGGAAKLIDASSPAVAGFVALFVHLARAVMPEATKLMKQFSGWINRVAGNASGLTGKEKFFVNAGKALTSIGRLAGSLGGLFVGLVETISPFGVKLIDFVTKGVKGFTAWLKSAEGQKKIKQFFDRVLPVVEKFVQFIVKLGKFFAVAFEAVAPFLDGFLQGLNDLLDLVTWIVDKFADFTNWGPIKFLLKFAGQIVAAIVTGRLLFKVLGFLGGKLKQFGKWIADAVKKVVNFVPGLKGALTAIFKFGKDLAGKIVGGIKSAASAVWNAGKWVVTHVWNAIKSLASWVGDKAKGIGRWLIKGLKRIAEPLWNAGKWVVQRLWGAIKSLAKWLGDKALALGRYFVRGWRRIGTAIWNAGKWVVTHLWNGAKTLVTWLAGKAFALARYFVRGWRRIGTAIWNAGKWVITHLWNAMKSLGTWLFKKAKVVIGTIVRGLRWFGSAIWNAGKDLLKGLINGFVHVGAWAWNKIKGLAKWIVRKVKSALGISSPSKVMFKLGQHMLSGLLGGFMSKNITRFIGRWLGGIKNLASDLAKTRLWGFDEGMLEEAEAKGVRGESFRGRVLRALKTIPEEGLRFRIPFGAGGMVKGPTNALIGERGPEAVVPLTAPILSALAASITSHMRVPQMTAPALAGGGTSFGDTHIHVTAPAGEYPDMHSAAAKLAREGRRRGGFRV